MPRLHPICDQEFHWMLMIRAKSSTRIRVQWLEKKKKEHTTQ